MQTTILPAFRHDIKIVKQKVVYMYKKRERERKGAKKIGWTQKKKAPGLPLHICGLGGAFNDFLLLRKIISA